MKFLAWLYLQTPMWVARKLPDSINYATDGPFSDALEEVYGRWADKQNRRANEKLRKVSGL